MSAASRADPELVRGPRTAGLGILEFHLGPAALASDTDGNVNHGRILARRHDPKGTEDVRPRYTWATGADPWARRIHMIPGVILAAGASSRMGRPKVSLPTDVPGETFLSRLITTLRLGGVDDVLVVTGADVSGLDRALGSVDPPPWLVENPDPARGQASSLIVALQAIDHPGVRAMLVTLVDVPLVTTDTVRALIKTYRRTGAPIVRPAQGDRHGHPVIFDRSLFDTLRAVDPTKGAKTVVRAYERSIINLPVTDEGAFTDIDTPADFERVFGHPLPEPR